MSLGRPLSLRVGCISSALEEKDITLAAQLGTEAHAEWIQQALFPNAALLKGEGLMGTQKPCSALPELLVKALIA